MHSKILSTSILTALLLLQSSTIILAQSEQSNATPSGSVTQTIKDRVQKVLESQTAQVAGTSTTASQSFAIVGTLEKVVGSTLSVKTISGVARLLEFDKSSTILRQGKPISREEIEINSPVIVIGIQDPDETYRVKSLEIVDDAQFQTKRITILGTMSSISTKAVLVSLLGVNAGGSVSYPITTKTSFFDLLGKKIEKKQITAGQKIIVVLPQTSETTATASAARIYSLTALPSAIGN